MRQWGSFVSIAPDVEDVLDDDRQCCQRSEGHADVCHNGVRDNVGDEETSSRATDADAEVSEGVVEVGHGLDSVHSKCPNQVLEIAKCC